MNGHHLVAQSRTVWASVFNRLIVAFVCAASCTNELDSPLDQQLPSTVGRIVQPVVSASKVLGEDCAKEGTSACLDGTCLHFGPASWWSGYVCSTRCQSTLLDCPEGWSCQSIYPGAGHEFCIPPENWTPRKATQPSRARTALQKREPQFEPLRLRIDSDAGIP